MKNPSLIKKVKNLPKSPGVYLFKDKNGKVIYVGKAKSLYSRVGSYFSLNLDESSKTYILVTKIDTLDFIEVASELEALILEAELIKRYKPKYNVVLKDDKSAIYIVIRFDSLKNIPKVVTTRKTQIESKDIVFGPFPSNNTAKNILSMLRKIFKFRDCSFVKFKRYEKLRNTCLYGHLGVCSGPCINQSPEDIKSYNGNIKKVKKILSGDTSSVLKELESKMLRYSKSENFEEAVRYRDLMAKFYYLQENFRDPQQYIENPYLIDDIGNMSAGNIKDFLPILKNYPRRIECYDISNISGKSAVGSMVVSTDGKIDKSQYRRFKIKLDQKPNDFSMMYEVLYRRLKNVLKQGDNKKSWEVPQLIVVDGGKPQVTAVLSVMDDLGLDIPIIGLAKKEETLVYKENGLFVEKKIDKNTLGMKLLISLRDEAHRFAQRYHHLLREKSLGV